MSGTAVVIVSFNTREVLRECLRSVGESRPSETVVVDNGSTDGSIEMVERDFPDVRLVRAENPGYGAAANLGVEATTAEYVLLLNSDTIIPETAPAAVAAYLDAHERVGILGPRLLNRDGSLQRSCFPFPTPRAAFLGETRLGYLIRFVPGVRKRHPRTWRHDRPRPMPWVSGAAMAIRRTAHDEVAGFDDSFFMYFEETDLCYRLWQAGWEVHFAPVTDIVHLGAASTSRWAAAMRVRYYESMAWFYQRHRSSRQRRALDAIIRVTSAARLFATRLRLVAARSGARRRRLAEEVSALTRLTRGVARHRSTSAPTAAPLRRLDWRFLLPAPPSGGRLRAVVDGDYEGLARRLAETGFAEHLYTSRPSNGDPVDAWVALGGRNGALPDIADSLTPGGYAYLEVKAAPGIAAGRIAHRETTAERAGLVRVAHYAVLPSLDAAKVYLPLDAPGALRWVVETLIPASTPLRRLLRGTLRAMGPRLLSRLLRHYPAQALVFARPPVEDAAPAPLVRAGIATTKRPLLLCDAGNRVVMLPFGDDDAPPEQVLKIPKLPVFNGRTRNEQERLREIRDHVPPRLREAMPESLGLVPLGATTMALERFRPGISLMVSSAEWRGSWRRKARDLHLAAEWLGDLHEDASINVEVWSKEQRERWVEQPARDFHRTFGTRPAEARLFADLRDRAESLDGSPFPLVWWHRDYNIWNIFRQEGRLSVIDWEGARPGPPLCDLIHFCTHWYEAVQGHRTESAKLQGFRHLYIRPRPRDRAAAAVHQVVRRYMTRLSLDPGLFPVLLGFTWIELALRRAEQRRDQGERDPDARQGNRNFPFIAALANGLIDQHASRIAAGPRG